MTEEQELKYLRGILRNAEMRAIEANVPFNLTINDLKILFKTKTCHFSGTAFIINQGINAASPSLHRLEPLLGYIKGNVVFICNCVNMCLSNHLEEQVYKIMENYVLFSKSRFS